MKAFTRSARLTLVVIASALLSAPLYAAGVQVNLDISNSHQSSPEGTNYLRVTISDGIAGNIDFKVEPLPPLSEQAGKNSGLQSFSFNFGNSGASADNILLSDGWSVKGGNKKSGVNHSIFGKFDIQVKGTGHSRQDPLEFSIVGVNGDTPEDYLARLSSGGRVNSLFATHVAGFNGPNSNHAFEQLKVTNGHFGGSSVVPIPAAAWLMLSALAVLGWRGKKSVARKSDLGDKNDVVAV